MTTSNEITLVGNVTADPELRYLTSGTALATFSVAVNRRYMKNGEWEEQTSFVDCVAWRDLADNVTDSIAKGDRVLVNGRLEQRRWENSEGENRSKIEVVVDDIGPSLRWATAVVSRTPRKGDGGAAKADQPPAEAYEDEEPF